MLVSLKKVLLGILVLTIVLFLCVYFFPWPVLRAVFGIPFLLFFPGFVLLAAIAPDREDMGTMERIILSFVLSIVADSLLGLLLHYTTFGITLDSVMITGTIFVELVTAIALIRQAFTPANQQVILEFKFRAARPASGAFNTVFTAIMALVLIGTLTAGLYFSFSPKKDETFTQFFIVEQEGGALYTPVNLAPGSEAAIVLGITNHEGNRIDYRVQVLLDGERYMEIKPIRLANGQEWREQITVLVQSSGEKQIEFLLFKNDEVKPYLESLRLWINSTNAGIASQR